ncbi:Hypothetical protein NAEGRDRAFT_66022 [Naegleria gruberi]|uniref:Uncharacterized protein n=1 Tax=Naegleria gruberi TaxID=5762 RepID=D2VAY4_NAEGR|nr:uncharacterized protein NAEGRDRAFT_66022 [Naegleria gruberi]EFC46030.1 Hypothetical protein NAEGRDRAFT_66022 [Naegleria gruberi]|eukprot:XP_002678774.1 Hypothetical protein NAEGRDRAFT_66022 [Naegleria gruberi strain NEG-M]
MDEQRDHPVIGLIQFLPLEVWYEHILTYFPSNLLLSTRLVNRNFSNIILSYFIKLKKEFNYSTFRLSKKQLKYSLNFLSRFENLQSFCFENPIMIINDKNDEQAMNSLLSDLVFLEHLQEIDLTSCNHDGQFIEKLLERNNSNRMIENLTSLSMNVVESEHFTLILEHFINLKSLKIENFEYSSFNNSIAIKLNDKLEELFIHSGITAEHLNQIMKQGRNLKKLLIKMSAIEMEYLDDLSAFENLTSLTIETNCDVSYVDIDQINSEPEFHANYFSSLKNLRNLTELELPWTISNENSDSVREFCHLSQLSSLKTLYLTILQGNDNQIEMEKTLEKIIVTISHLYNLTDLSLDFLEIFTDFEEIDQNVLDNIPQLTKLEKFTFVGIPYQDGTHVKNLCDYYCVPTLKYLSVSIKDGIIPSRNDLKSVESIEMVIEEENDVYYQLFNKTNLSNITSLEIGLVKLKDLELISQMTNLKDLSMKLGNISSFKSVKFPKSLQSLVLEDCNFLTGMENEHFFDSFGSCPFLEIINFTKCPLLQDSFVRKLSKWIENSLDCKQIMFNQCDGLTNDSVFYFKDLKNCKYVHFYECRELYFTMEISNLLMRNTFIEVETACIVPKRFFDRLNNTESYIIHEEEIVNSLENFENMIRKLLELRQFQKASLYLQANMFENCSEESGNHKKLHQLLQDKSTLFETKWFFYYSFLKCHVENITFTTYADVEFIYNQAIELIFTQTNQNEEFIEDLKILLVELFETGKEFECMMNNKSLEYITTYLYEKRDFDKLLKCALTEESALELVNQITEKDCFQLTSLNNLLELNEDFLDNIIEKRSLFKNSPSFTEKMRDRGIEMDENDSELLEINQRVPERFRNSYLTELTVTMSEKNDFTDGESEAFNAFGFRWNLKVQEEGDRLLIDINLLSCIPLNRKFDSYENINGNDGDSIEISFMLLNYDNNPYSYMSGRKIFDQSSMQHTFEISTTLIEEFSENNFKFLIGLGLISIKERITCPFTSTQFVIHNLSFDIASDLKDCYLDEIILYSAPITIFGTNWNVKFVQKLESGIIELYLMLASLDLFDDKAAIHACCVEFYFANKNLHPDSTFGMKRSFNSQNTPYGGPIEHQELLKPEKRVNLNGELVDRYEISLIMNVKSISKKHYSKLY